VTVIGSLFNGLVKLYLLAMHVALFLGNVTEVPTSFFQPLLENIFFVIY
jgi:hypothetical protein